MSIEELSPEERKIWYCGYREGKRDGKRMAGYLLVAFVIIFASFLSLVLEKH